MKVAIWDKIVLASILVIIFSILFAFYEYHAQKCITDTISAQLGFLEDPDVNAAVPDEMKRVVDSCSFWLSMIAAVFLGFISLAAAILGAILSNRLRVKSSTTIHARYEPDSHKLILRFNKPTIVENPQRMTLLYYHTGGVSTTIPGRQCGDDGLTLTFDASTEKSPTYVELVIYPKAIQPAGFPESDICPNGSPIHVDVDIR